MRITVVGTGYVGLVTGTCLAEIGNEVICVDVNEEKINKLRNGIPPIYEEHLEEMINNNLAKNRLKFTTSLERGVKLSDVIFIAVGTPPKSNGQIDMSQVDEVAKSIGKYINGYKVIVNKSTVPVGSANRVKNIVYLNMKDKSIEFDVVSNPEFLREGTAVFDTFNGDRIVIGSNSEKATEIMKEIYESFNIPMLITNPESAEMIKYASNAFLATKISFINEIANVCERVGADVKEVAKGMGIDKRIGNKFLNAGIGFGGACFPKDIKGLMQIGNDAGYEFKIVKKVLEVNNAQRIKPVEMLRRLFGNLNGVNVSILGLSFKPGTDDLREAPSLYVIKELQSDGANIKAYDPIAMENAKLVIGNSMTYCNDPYEAVEGSDVVVLLTEWAEFKKLDFNRVKELVNRPLIIDGRNTLDSNSLKEKGFEYFGIGLGDASVENTGPKESRIIRINQKKACVL
ncbi:UDP-glucose dehydrogenase family protein [Caldisalinibacter kiritimatiensis]|uniref:UDP-glucose 6-dehydrogenase n=1 Tax=Caldisalinibacter kiritimatiensis TaxID=1304284 RepID=R1CLL2_9FIRM|nr:UDP-glucose/GDP-mannose dehydrogenase family protein [Caldisalinibacter kiritimatiensis]EOC99580.1 UDP-glucose dehydrogenase [Caldisalinibacter kiritimatiensis]